MNNLSQELTELRLRNEVRLAAAKESMGSKWLLHPDNTQKKLKVTVKKRLKAS